MGAIRLYLFETAVPHGADNPAAGLGQGAVGVDDLNRALTLAHFHPPYQDAGSAVADLFLSTKIPAAPFSPPLRRGAFDRTGRGAYRRSENSIGSGRCASPPG